MRKLSIILAFLYAIAVCCVSAAAAVFPTSVENIAAALGFSPAEKGRLYRGEIVAADLPETSDKMLAQTVAMVVPTGIDQITARLLHGNILETDRDVIAYGRIDPAHIEASLKYAVFTSADRDEISRLQNGKFDAFNLSSTEIAHLRSADRSTLAAVAEAYRRILVARTKAYIGGGLGAVEAYQRSKGNPTRATEDLRRMAETIAVLADSEPAVYRAFLDYPKHQPAGIETAFFWIKKRADKRVVFTLAHRIIQSHPESVTILRREFFVGHSFNAAQTATGIFPVAQGAILFSENCTTSDQVAGFGEKLRHKIGRNLMREELIRRFKNLRAVYTR
ncbi:MAG: hypothetical protein ACU837_11320 [Gammaproteobacteria bacterium]